MQVNLSVEDGDWDAFLKTREMLEEMLDDAIELAKKHKVFGVQAIIANMKENIDILYVFRDEESEVKNAENQL